MKAYRVDGICCDTIFYVGYRSQVESQLREFFQWEQRQSINEGSLSVDNNVHNIRKVKENNYESNNVGQGSKKSSHFSSNQSSINRSQQRKRTSIHFLLYDLTLHQYNNFQTHIKTLFSDKISKHNHHINLHFVMISSRQQSLKYIKKIDKFNSDQFESNLVQLYEDLNEGMEYELIRNFLQEKFNFTKDEVFQWMKQMKVKKLEDLFTCQAMASYQKKEVRKVLTNLSVLEKLYEEK